MLQTLYIQNAAIMLNETISFGPGFNVVTGESGAGKSILIDCIDMLLGARAQRNMIGSNGETLFIEGIFKGISVPTSKKLESLGICSENDELIISREISRTSSISRLNGRAVTLSHIRDLSTDLFDLHSQNDHRFLLTKNRYLDMIDQYGKESAQFLDILRIQIREERSIIQEMHALPQSLAERDRAMDLLQFQIQELESIDLYKIDEKEIEEEYSRLTHTKELLEGLNAIYESFEPSDYEKNGVLDTLRSSARLFEKLVNYDKTLEPLSVQAIDLLQEAIDLSYEISNIASNIQPDDERLFELDQILTLLTKLKRKYGPDLEDVCQFYEEALNNYRKLEEMEVRQAELAQALDEVQKDIGQTCSIITSKRKEIAECLTNQMMLSFHQLEMPNTRFKIIFESKDKWDDMGQDEIDFLISTNPGEPLQPLSKVASGGELSRIMLAFKSVIADVDDIPTMIFDEIDTGLSGKAARIVGQKIKYIAIKHQVIAVSHLPQIASLAETHLRVYKNTLDEQTSAHVEVLDHPGRIEELARLIGGKIITEATRKNAEELIEQARSL